MTLLTVRGEGQASPYEGQPMHILAGHGGQPPGSAVMEITVPPHFAGSIPHAHDDFDEAITYSPDGCWSSVKMSRRRRRARCLWRPRGHRDGFSNPSGEVAQVLGL